MKWAELTSGSLVGCTCLWQDQDGLHVAQAPEQPPLTSILWGWADDRLVRVRLDGDTVYAATVDKGAQGMRRLASVTPWTPSDKRVQAVRPANLWEGIGDAFIQVLVDGIKVDVGPITFLRAGIAQSDGSGAHHER